MEETKKNELFLKILLGEPYAEVLKDLDEDSLAYVGRFLRYNDWLPEDGFASFPKLIEHYDLDLNDLIRLLLNTPDSESLKERLIMEIGRAKHKIDPTLEYLFKKLITPQVAEALNQACKIENNWAYFKFLTPVEQKSKLAQYATTYTEAKKQLNQNKEARFNNANSEPLYQSTDALRRLRSHLRGTGWYDKQRLANILPGFDIDWLIKEVWPNATNVGRMLFLAHPNLPETYIAKALYHGGKHLSGRSPRKYPVTFGAKLTWDLIRDGIKLKMSPKVLSLLRNAHISGNNLTCEELDRWIFPTLLKSAPEYRKKLQDKYHSLHADIVNISVAQLKKELHSTKMTEALRNWAQIMAGIPGARELVLEIASTSAREDISVKELIALDEKIKKFTPSIYDIRNLLFYADTKVHNI